MEKFQKSIRSSTVESKRNGLYNANEKEIKMCEEDFCIFLLGVKVCFCEMIALDEMLHFLITIYHLICDTGIIVF